MLSEKSKTLAVLTSGGDSQGMNAALRAIVVRADVGLAGRQPGTELADLFRPAGDGILSAVLNPPLERADGAHLRVEVADHQGNVTRVDRKFTVATPKP